MDATNKKSPFYYDKYAEAYDNLVYTVSSTANGKSGEVIVKDYIREPLGASVTHSWTNEGGGIFSFWTNMMTSLASSSTYLDKMSDAQKTFLNQWSSVLSDKDASQSMSDFVGWIDYYKTYKGSVVNIPLTLQAILLKGGPCPAETDNTPTQKLEKILKYFAPKKKEGKSSDYGVIFQPPHNYAPTINEVARNANGMIDGTLTLTYGPLIINNLLLSNFDYTISKERCEGEPLYIAVNFTLIPALTFTKDHLPK